MKVALRVPQKDRLLAWFQASWITAEMKAADESLYAATRKYEDAAKMDDRGAIDE